MPTTPRTLRPGASGPPGARLLVLLAVLAGLFAMHGLSDHGMTHSSSEAAAHHAAMADADHADHGADRSAATTTVATALADPDMAMALCLAVLVGAVALLLTRGRASWSPVPRAVLERVRHAVPARARDPDPPDLVVLSIQRC